MTQITMQNDYQPCRQLIADCADAGGSAGVDPLLGPQGRGALGRPVVVAAVTGGVRNVSRFRQAVAITPLITAPPLHVPNSVVPPAIFPRGICSRSLISQR